ncbi:hypothetical protein APA66_33250 [Pseudomonas aeruginosa]|nr:hypothetical protein APA66_33250 [Pseudomonas aeruginosa]RQC39816.1 hypothetical protein IPC390_14330 [Pseudomonas aeruginosa]
MRSSQRAGGTQADSGCGVRRGRTALYRAHRRGGRLLSAESGGKGRNEKAAPGKVPARPGPFGVVPSRTPQYNKCAADVKRPHWSRGAACCRAAVFPGRRKESIKGGQGRKAPRCGAR